MSAVRPIDWDAAQNRRETGRLGHILYSGESCFIMAMKTPAGVDGAPLHLHESDQLYYVIDGELEIELGVQTVVARAGDGVFIPAGLPHRNRNLGYSEAVHLEIIAPAVQAGKPLATLIGDGPRPPHDGPPPRVASPEPSSGDRMNTSWLIRRAHGSEHVGVYVADMPPGKGGPPTHVHGFDQFYFVLAGELKVEVALEEFTVGPNSLVVLPAGVPHRQSNESGSPERHLAILVPEPEFPSTPEKRWDTAVDFAVAEDLQ